MNSDLVISVVIPAYQEEENLRIILPRLQQTLSILPYGSEVIVVDTMQQMDNAKEVCTQLGTIYKNREHGNNYGDAIRTGIESAKGKYIICMDADGSHTPEFIHKLIEHRDGFDVVIASRYIDGGTTDNSKLLIFMSLVVNIMYSFVLGIKCKDVSNSFRLYRAERLKSLHLKCANFDIVEEILFKLVKKNRNFEIKEVPFYFKKRMFGHTKRNLVAFMFSYLFTIIKLKFDL
ncbi:MAG: glycosyltransferase [Deltaproteobacteria bacterium]|nr:glycosyltransferase [Deltaproteobacteria bacterium]